MKTPKMLVALDGSRTSESILAYVETLLRRQDANVTLFMVIPRDRPAETRSGQTYLDGVAQRLRRKGAVVDTRLQVGTPAEQIAAFAKGGDFDLIALCSRGKSGLKRALFGSTSEEVLRLTSTPVLVVPPLERHPAPSAIRKIVVPHDGSHRSGEALKPAAELALAQDSKICFVTVVSPTKKEELPVEIVAENLFRQQRELQKKNLEVEIAVLYGDPSERLIAFAQENQADLVALSTHGRSGLDRVLYGSVAESVLRKGQFPLLVVRTAAIPKTAGTGSAALRAKHRAFEHREEGVVASRTAYTSR
jgi:nucleotide-binding universal stress UspA family protein